MNEKTLTKNLLNLVQNCVGKVTRQLQPPLTPSKATREPPLDYREPSTAGPESTTTVACAARRSRTSAPASRIWLTVGGASAPAATRLAFARFRRSYICHPTVGRVARRIATSRASDQFPT